DDYLKRLQESKGITIDLLIIDYLTIMDPNNTNGSLYQNGKALAEGIRAIAQKYNLCALSAMQVAKDAFDANDISAKDISESKAILETSDTLFAIIRTPQMKKEGIYYLKIIKLRDGDFKWIKCRFKMNKQYLLLEEDSIIE
ncbi:MAG: DnaB-like helicase C-terminal domain-containing protein, partial [Candidatus Heimdallarchaeota archaeon]